MRRIFFLKKIEVYLLQLVLKQRREEKSIFQLFLYFLLLPLLQYNKAINILFNFNCLLLSLEFFFSKNILSLLAGKSEQICTAFPLTTFSRQKYARRAFKKFLAKSLIQFLVQKFKNQVERAMFSCNLSRTRLLWKARCGLLRALPSTPSANFHAAKSLSLFCLSQHEN